MQVQGLEHAFVTHVHSGSNIDRFVSIIDAATVKNEACNCAMFDKLAVSGDH